jgi:CHAT domain
MDKIRVLFLAADPSDASRLRLGQELRDIREKLQLSKYREKFILESRESVRPGDISQAIFDTEPQIVHFSGHGTKTGELCFEDKLGKTQPVNPDSLAELFELVADQIRCVVLNACYSEMQAKAISKHIPFVVGMNQAIGDKAAIDFSSGFYKALGANRSFEEAYKFGRTEIKLQGVSGDLTPVLFSQESCKKTEPLQINSATKYYIYLSETKISMLFPQVENSLSLDDQEAKTEGAINAPNIYSKLNKIIHKLNGEKMLGTLESNLPYISDKLRMKWASFGHYRENAPITFWGYETEDLVFALAGSKHHLLGESKQSCEYGYTHSCSLTEAITNWLRGNFGDPGDPLYEEDHISYQLGDYNLSEYDIANAIWLAAGKRLKGQESDFEFVAKVLHRSNWLGFRNSKCKKIILATPLYVSLGE